MSLESVLCGYANQLEAELQNWVAQVSELTDQLQVAVHQKDEALSKLEQIRRQFATDECYAAKTCVQESNNETQTHGPRQTGKPRQSDESTTPWPPAGRTNSAQRPPRA
jgi:hypothetical protein